MIKDVKETLTEIILQKSFMLNCKISAQAIKYTAQDDMDKNRDDGVAIANFYKAQGQLDLIDSIFSILSSNMSSMFNNAKENNEPTK